MKKIDGLVLIGVFERNDTYHWVDDKTGTTKPINFIKVLYPRGDGTVTRESITLPPNYKAPALVEGQMYAFPVTARYNKKRQQITWDARPDLLPFEAPQM